MEQKKEVVKDLAVYQFLNELTMQIFADRYRVNLKLKEVYKNNKERKIEVNCSSSM